MTLVEYLKKYREEHGLSQRDLARQCGLSPAYISILEREYNPSTKKPAVPTLDALKALANGMGTTLDELFATVDDMPVRIVTYSSHKTDEKTKREIMDLFEILSEDQQQLALSLLRQLADKAK